MDKNKNKSTSTGVRMGTEQRYAQVQAIESVERWYVEQAERLGVEVAEIEAAVARGWPGDWIAILPASEVHRLSGPPVSPEIAAGMKRIEAAVIKPVRNTRPARDSGGASWRREPSGSGTMANAFKEAKNH